MPLNQRLLRLAVANQAGTKLIREVRPFVELDFDSKKEQMMEAFEQHPVTQELEEGPTAFSRFESLRNAGGNLFSMLGFFESQSPAQAVREVLDENTVLGSTKKGVLKGKKLIFSTPVKFPTVEEVDKKVAENENGKLDWTNRPFTDLISQGISGLPNYLFDLTKDWSYPPSRSGTAIQTKGKPLRGGSVGKIPYVSDILGVFKRLLSGKR